MSKVSTTINKHHNKLLIALVVVILLMVVFILYRVSQDHALPEATTADILTDNTPLIGKVVELENQNKISVGSKTVALPEGWIFNTAYQNTADSKFKCATEDPTNCRVYTITDGYSNYYLSTPEVIKSEGGLVSEKLTNKLTFGGEQVVFTYEKLDMELADEVASTSINLYYQIYGCNTSQVCLSTLPLETNTAVNQSQTRVFEELVALIKIN